MSERDCKLKIIQRFEILREKIDEYDRHNYYLDLKNRKKPALIIMQLSHTGNGYINGSYVNTSAYKTTKAGDINIKKLTDSEIMQLIDEAIHNITYL